MGRARLIIYAILLSLIGVSPAVADDFDGSKPLLCAVIDVVECGWGGECRQVTPERANIPQFFRIDFQEKMLIATGEDGMVRSTHIERVERVDGKLILQGAEDGLEGVRDGLGWSMATSEDTGRFVLTGSGDQVGFVIFGACTPQ